MSGLEIQDLTVGSGLPAVRGDTVTIRYSAYLNRGDRLQTDVTTEIALGRRQAIAGLERGVEGMRVGGIRHLRVSPHLAYGEKGVEGVIPKNALLVFEVELVALAHSDSENKPKDSGQSRS